MIRIYLRLAIPLIIIFIALNIAARALGSTQPPNPALRGFTEGCEGKPQPCWYGIVPGVTSLETAVRIIKKQPIADYFIGSNIYQNYLDPNVQIITTFAGNYLQEKCYIEVVTQNKQDTIGVITLKNCIDLKLGDILNLFGEPKYTIFPSIFHSWTQIHFATATVFIDYPAINSLSTYLVADSLVIVPSTKAIVNPCKWGGAALKWRYC